VMGVVNITPDSFSDGGAYLSAEVAVEHALRLLDEGADLLDLGAESTRPGSPAGSQAGSQGESRKRGWDGGNDGAINAQTAVRSVPVSVEPVSAEPVAAELLSADKEQARLLPVLEGVIKARPGAIVSVDTYKADTARVALAAGAEIVNDVSGFNWDPAMAGVCAQAGCGVVLMHTRGRPDEWKAQIRLEQDELLRTVWSGLQASCAHALSAGVSHESIVLDPGYGFGKRGEENFALLARQAQLLALGRPLVAGVSRKSFLGGALAPLYGGKAAPVDARETASVAAMVAAILHGASVVRVHSVRAAVEAALVADAVDQQRTKNL